MNKIKYIFILIFCGFFMAACSDSLPTSAEYLIRGEGYHKDGKVEKAIKEYNKALKLNPNNIDVYASRGTAYFFMGDLEKAIDDFVKVVQSKPDADSYAALGAALAAGGENHKALEFLNAAINIKPQKPESYLSRGSIYYNLGEYAAAVEDYSAVIALQPFEGAYLARAAAYEKLGRAEAAATDMETAKDPNTSKYLNPIVNSN